MVKRVLAILASLILTIALPLMVLADTSVEKLIDGANILSSSGFEEVKTALEDVSNKYGVDIAVLTTNGLDGKTIRDFSDDYYDQHGYGTGSDRSGVLLVVDMGSREVYISTSGEGITAVTDYGRDLLANRIMPAMGDGNYARAFKEYATTMDEYFAAEREGRPVDNYGGGQEEKTEYGAGTYALGGGISVAGGAGIAAAATGAMKRKMKTVVRQRGASAYASEEGLKLTESTDRYLYHRIVVIPLPRNDGPRGGGSSIHTSSGGFTHGGGSLGKF